MDGGDDVCVRSTRLEPDIVCPVSTRCNNDCTVCANEQQTVCNMCATCRLLVRVGFLLVADVLDCDAC